MDLLLETLERESSRLLPNRPVGVDHFIQSLTGIALDHIGEANDQGKSRPDLLSLELLPERLDGYQTIQVEFRTDAPGGTPEMLTHVRFTAGSLPANVILGKRYSMDALVIRSERGRVRFQCLHPLPRFFKNCSWKMRYCGSFVTARTMFDAVRTFYTLEDACCEISGYILGTPAVTTISETQSLEPPRPAFVTKENLNASQNAAVESALTSPLTCLWGPPGTGKTETIVTMIEALREAFPDKRMLVTAPTHNAVDNVLRRHISNLAKRGIRPDALRVSTDVSLQCHPSSWNVL